MIVVESLSKRFGRVLALQDVSASFKEGRVTAVMGPNGSGKSTLIKCILGLVRPEKGQITVGGRLADKDGAYRALIGYMPQKPQFPGNLTVRELLLMMQDIRNQRNLPEDPFMEELKLRPYLDRRVKGLSGGTKQKINAMLAFQFGSPFLILDEPSASLDPISVACFKERVVREKRAGRGIIITSHVLPEIEALADDALFMLDGQVVFAGPIEEMRMRAGGVTFEEAVLGVLQGAPQEGVPQ